MEIYIQIKYRPHALLFIVLSLLIWNPVLNSQELVLNIVPPNNGENIDFVTGITQDANGLMWFSTKVGLLSYDGKNLKSFKNNPFNPNSLVSNFTESICADNGKIWIGTLGYGLDRFDPATGIFTHFLHNPDDSTSLSNDTVTQILKDRDGILWIGTHGGLNQYDPDNNRFIHYKKKSDDNTSLSSNQVRVLYEDRQGTLWVGTGSPYQDNGGGPLDGGLNRMDKKTGTFTQYLHNPENENSLMNNKIGAIYEDNKGVLWIGTAKNGLCRMNPETGIVDRIKYDASDSASLSSLSGESTTVDYEHITFITQDDTGSYWIGTTESGVYYANPGKDHTPEYGKDFHVVEGFKDRGAWSSFTSRDGIFWLGSIDGNIYRVNPSPRKIPHFNTNALVNSFYEAPNGDLWVATEQKIIIIKTTNGISKQSEFDATPDNVQDDNVQFLYGDSQGNLWIGGSGGVGIWDNANNKLVRYLNDPNKRNSLSNNNVVKIYEDKQENIWVGTTDGLNLFNRKRGDFKKYYMNQVDTSFVGLNIVTSVLQKKGGQFWVGTWNGGGVYAFDPLNNKRKNYLSGTSVVCLFEDSENEIWLGSNYGLFRYDAVLDDFVRYLDPFQVNGIFLVAGIVEDNNNFLWISTGNGLARINPERNETNTLGKAYGLESTNFSWNGCYKGRDGKLYFGDDSGYYVLNPEEVFQNTDAPQIVFTGFRLANNIVVPGMDSPLNKNLAEAGEIILKHDQNIFSFDYAIIDYVNPEENQLTYFLENYDKNWQLPNSEQRAYYFNVPPGEYIFHVRGANSYGVWAEKKIAVIVSPPWWLSYWAYGIYGVLFLLLIFGFDRVQRRRIRLIERQKTYQRELAQAKEIEKAYTTLKATQAQLIQSEKMASLGELTAGIAHEIQNPLNFVNNFSELSVDLVDELEDEMENGNAEEVKAIRDDLKLNLEKINHHGNRASSIVKGMLEHSRTGSEEKLPTDINALCDEYLRLAYHGLRAKDKSFNAEFKLDADDSLPEMMVVPQDIGRVLLNLINNAFYTVAEKSKLSNKDYKPEVYIVTKKLDDGIEIRVKDNGNGITDVVKDKIFQPFFTTKPAGKGTGLGLSMSYDIITKGHGGELRVESKQEKGTEFIILLPKKLA